MRDLSDEEIKTVVPTIVLAAADPAEFASGWEDVVALLVEGGLPVRAAHSDQHVPSALGSAGASLWALPWGRGRIGDLAAAVILAGRCVEEQVTLVHAHDERAASLVMGALAVLPNVQLLVSLGASRRSPQSRVAEPGLRAWVRRNPERAFALIFDDEGRGRARALGFDAANDIELLGGLGDDRDARSANARAQLSTGWDRPIRVERVLRAYDRVLSGEGESVRLGADGSIVRESAFDRRRREHIYGKRSSK